MKERWEYSKLNTQINDNKWKMIYYKTKQRMIWKFYIRIIQDGYGWFIPCDKCQTRLTDMWNRGFYLMDEDYEIVGFMFRSLCKKCMQEVQTKLRDCPILIGNKDYEPWVELSRRWTDDNDVEISFAEYKKHQEEHR